MLGSFEFPLIYFLFIFCLCRNVHILWLSLSCLRSSHLRLFTRMYLWPDCVWLCSWITCCAKHILYYSCCLSSYLDFSKFHIFWECFLSIICTCFLWLKVEPQNSVLLYVTYVVFFLVLNNIGPFNIHCSSLSINWHGRWGGWGERCVIWPIKWL